jgi:hypothetical protein
LAPGQWYEIPGTALSSIDPSPRPPGATGPASKVIAWTSLAVDTRTSTLYSVAGGGHTDYAGNEVDAVNLAATAPVWRRLRAPSTSVADSAYYPDGRPTSRHHYYGLFIDEASGRVMLFGGSRWQSGAILSSVDSFNLSTNDYHPQGSHPNFPSSVSGQEVRAICRDPRNNDVYVFANYSVAKWNRSTNTWTTLINGSAPYFAGHGSAFDTRRNVIHLVVGGGQNYEYNVSTNSFVTRRTSGGSVSGNGAAVVYVPAIDAFLVRSGEGGGGGVMRIDAATFAVSSFSTSGGSGIPSTMNGPYNKFLYVPQLQGCVYVPSHTSSVWYLRVH